jgi:hypothetical protein
LISIKNDANMPGGLAPSSPLLKKIYLYIVDMAEEAIWFVIKQIKLLLQCTNDVAWLISIKNDANMPGGLAPSPHQILSPTPV